jgi:hypothetical protein
MSKRATRRLKIPLAPKQTKLIQLYLFISSYSPPSSSIEFSNFDAFPGFSRFTARIHHGEIRVKMCCLFLREFS